jgi:hypothetical protein
MDEPTPLPAPLRGCLICHSEGTLELSEKRRTLRGYYPILTCTNCGSTALFDWKSDQENSWRIYYRKISRQVYAYAALRFLKAGWLRSDDALDLSTEVYIQRQRIRQVSEGDLKWLKPAPLLPPLPLMTADELVYLTLKPVYYCESAETRLPLMRRRESILDTGTFYVTNSKIHLLGQRRDRSHRLADIVEVVHQPDAWYVYLGIGRASHYYRGMGQPNLDAEVIVAVVNVLRLR